MVKGEQANWKDKEKAAVKELGEAFTMLLGDATSKDVISVLTDIVHDQCLLETLIWHRIRLLQGALQEFIRTGEMDLKWPTVERLRETTRIEIVKRTKDRANSLRGLAQDKKLGYWPPDYFAKVD